MSRASAGVLLYRRRGDHVEVLLVHPGGPFWAKKDRGAWSIPKGEYQEDEDPKDAAQREFQEETGLRAEGELRALTPLKQPSGKIVRAWALEGDCDPATIRSNSFKMEWPPRSGKEAEFPEIDRGAWFTLTEAREKILPGQLRFLEELAVVLSQVGL